MLQVSQGWIKRNDGNLDRVSMAVQLDALAANISGVKEHPALLGYYIVSARSNEGTVLTSLVYLSDANGAVLGYCSAMIVAPVEATA